MCFEKDDSHGIRGKGDSSDFVGTGMVGDDRTYGEMGIKGNSYIPYYPCRPVNRAPIPNHAHLLLSDHKHLTLALFRLARFFFRHLLRFLRWYPDRNRFFRRFRDWGNFRCFRLYGFGGYFRDWREFRDFRMNGRFT